MAKTKITRQGYEKLLAELKRLKEVERPQIIKRIAAARELGDLSENSDYDDARDQQSFIEGRILDLENQLKNCQIIDKTGTNGKVVLGARVTVITGGKKEIFELVGANEADPLAGKISEKSPIGSALMGAKVGERVTVNTPGGTVEYKILKVE